MPLLHHGLFNFKGAKKNCYSDFPIQILMPFLNFIFLLIILRLLSVQQHNSSPGPALLVGGLDRAGGSVDKPTYRSKKTTQKSLEENLRILKYERI